MTQAGRLRSLAFHVIFITLGIWAFTPSGFAQRGGEISSRAAKLEAIKKEFPAHVSGPVTEKSDPLIVKAWEKYRDAVDELDVDNLADMVGQIRHNLERDIERADYEKKYPDTAVKTASMRFARQQNLAWFKQKLLPYVKRLEQFQRGR